MELVMVNTQCTYTLLGVRSELPAGDFFPCLRTHDCTSPLQQSRTGVRALY